jgi:hypothetical protein
MSTMPAVIVKKGGAFSALFHGLFGFLTAIVVCAAGLGFYALHIADDTVGGLFTLTGNVASSLPQWKQALPPALAEALDDRRAPDYRDQIDVSVRAVPDPEHGSRELAVITVANNGLETITILALNVLLEDGNGVPREEFRTYAATPLTIDEGDWRGPLLPGSTRKFSVCRWGERARGLQPTVEVTELRLWNGPQADQEGEDDAAET